MPNPRKEIITTQETYHVFNRSIAGEEIFTNKNTIKHMLELLDFYRFPQIVKYSKYKTFSPNLKMDFLSKLRKQNPLVEIYAYALMPTHFHLLLEQLVDNGVRLYISNFQNGFAKYYNTLKDRKGGLFQSPFKAKRVTTDNEFLHVSRYIHLNPLTSYLMKFEELVKSNVTSFPLYVSSENNGFISTQKIINLSGSTKKYLRFVEEQINYQRELDKIKHLLIDVS